MPPSLFRTMTALWNIRTGPNNTLLIIHLSDLVIFQFELVVSQFLIKRALERGIFDEKKFNWKYFDNLVFQLAPDGGKLALVHAWACHLTKSAVININSNQQ